MKRAKLIAHLLRSGCILLREGAKHSIYRNLFTGNVEREKRTYTYVRFRAEEPEIGADLQVLKHRFRDILFC